MRVSHTTDRRVCSCSAVQSAVLGATALPSVGQSVFKSIRRCMRSTIGIGTHVASCSAHRSDPLPRMFLQCRSQQGRHPFCRCTSKKGRIWTSLRTSGSNLSSVCSSRRRLGFPRRWTETLNPKTPCPRSSSGGTGAVLRCGWQLRAVTILLDPQASHARVRTGACARGWGRE